MEGYMLIPCRVEKVIAEGTNPAGDRIELVHCVDGTFGVRTGAEVLSAYRWPEDEVGYAVAEFMKMTGHPECQQPG
jgi:hypothetical protein